MCQQRLTRIYSTSIRWKGWLGTLPERCRAYPPFVNFTVDEPSLLKISGNWGGPFRASVRIGHVFGKTSELLLEDSCHMKGCRTIVNEAFVRSGKDEAQNTTGPPGTSSQHRVLRWQDPAFKQAMHSVMSPCMEAWRRMRTRDGRRARPGACPVLRHRVFAFRSNRRFNPAARSDRLCPGR